MVLFPYLFLFRCPNSSLDTNYRTQTGWSSVDTNLALVKGGDYSSVPILRTAHNHCSFRGNRKGWSVTKKGTLWNRTHSLFSSMATLCRFLAPRVASCHFTRWPDITTESQTVRVLQRLFSPQFLPDKLWKWSYHNRYSLHTVISRHKTRRCVWSMKCIPVPSGFA